MKKIFMLSILIFSINTYAVTVDDLIKRYGKQAIMDVIADKLDNIFMMTVEGSTLFASPNINYINAATLTADMRRAGMNTTNVESVILEKIKLEKIEQEQRILAEKAAQEQKILAEKAAQEQKLLAEKAAQEQRILVEKEAIEIIAKIKERQQKIDKEKEAMLAENKERQQKIEKEIDEKVAETLKQQHERRLEHSNTRPNYSTSKYNYRKPDDDKAYKALRSRGWSDTEANEAASSVRKLCEATGGTDCK